MLGAPILDALDRIAARAQDVRDAYRAGAIPAHGDVRTGGSIAATIDPLSVVAPPGAWFVTEDGAGRRAYTRDGGFTLADGRLRTRDGALVLGYRGGDARAAVAVPLRIAPAEVALGRGADPRVDADGTVSYARVAIDPRTGARSIERIAIGTVALARFPAATAPLRIDAVHVGAPDGVAPHLGTPGDGAFAPLATRSRDAGSLNLDAGLERLNEAYLAFEALGAAHRARGGLDQTILDIVK